MTEQEMLDRIEELEFERTKDREKIHVLNAELMKLRMEFEQKRIELQSLWHNVRELWKSKQGA